MDPSSLSKENIVATAVAGLGIGIIAIWKYLKELKAPTAPNGDRIVPELALADMKPFKDIAEAQSRTALANERIALGVEGLLKLFTDQARDDAIEEEVERRLRERQADRRRRTTRA